MSANSWNKLYQIQKKIEQHVLYKPTQELVGLINNTGKSNQPTRNVFSGQAKWLEEIVKTESAEQLQAFWEQLPLDTGYSVLLQNEGSPMMHVSVGALLNPKLERSGWFAEAFSDWFSKTEDFTGLESVLYQQLMRSQSQDQKNDLNAVHSTTSVLRWLASSHNNEALLRARERIAKIQNAVDRNRQGKLYALEVFLGVVQAGVKRLNEEHTDGKTMLQFTQQALNTLNATLWESPATAENEQQREAQMDSLLGTLRWAFLPLSQEGNERIGLEHEQQQARTFMGLWILRCWALEKGCKTDRQMLFQAPFVREHVDPKTLFGSLHQMLFEKPERRFYGRSLKSVCKEVEGYEWADEGLQWYQELWSVWDRIEANFSVLSAQLNPPQFKKQRPKWPRKDRGLSGDERLQGIEELHSLILRTLRTPACFRAFKNHARKAFRDNPNYANTPALFEAGSQGYKRLAMPYWLLLPQCKILRQEIGATKPQVVLDCVLGRWDRILSGFKLIDFFEKTLPLGLNALESERLPEALKTVFLQHLFRKLKGNALIAMEELSPALHERLATLPISSQEQLLLGALKEAFLKEGKNDPNVAAFLELWSQRPCIKAESHVMPRRVRL